MEDPRHVLSRYGLSPKKSFSQNFIISSSSLDVIVNACLLNQPADTPIVELGAGLGTLTAALARIGARVYAVERDRELVEVLKAEFATTDLIEVVAGDAASIDLTRFISNKQPYVCVVGNLPYAITGAIIKNLITARHYLSQAIFTVQREVRDRLQADPGVSDYGALTVFTQAAFQVRTLKHLPASAFYPRPKIRSSIVQLLPLDPPRAVETPTFRLLVHAAFQARRKTLRNALLQSRETKTDRIDSVLVRAAIDGRRRGETLSVEEFACLAIEWDKVFADEE
jgi:16S rRNA (adenine1518-N6/adenine1519-N6)-dimethyltransferase